MCTFRSRDGLSTAAELMVRLLTPAGSRALSACDLSTRLSRLVRGRRGAGMRRFGSRPRESGRAGEVGCQKTTHWRALAACVAAFCDRPVYGRWCIDRIRYSRGFNQLRSVRSQWALYDPASLLAVPKSWKSWATGADLPPRLVCAWTKGFGSLAVIWTPPSTTYQEPPSTRLPTPTWHPHACPPGGDCSAEPAPSTTTSVARETPSRVRSARLIR